MLTGENDGEIVWRYFGLVKRIMFTFVGNSTLGLNFDFGKPGGFMVPLFKSTAENNSKALTGKGGKLVVA